MKEEDFPVLQIVEKEQGFEEIRKNFEDEVHGY